VVDVIVVGSGAAAVNAAYPLCEAGLDVMMLDYGNRDGVYSHLVPAKDFTQIRLTEDGQHRYFLGDEYEGIPLGDIRVGATLTPPRQYVIADTAELTPVDSDTFMASESLAVGGLASGWGAGVLPFRREDLADMPISLADITPNYKRVAERIGISGGDDDLRRVIGDYGSLMPPVAIDSNAETVLKRYELKRERLKSRGVFIGRTPLAVVTRPHRGRGPHRYYDMDYWADTDNSVYRPRYTLEELTRFSNFAYVGDRIVTSFKESRDNEVEVIAKSKDGVEESHKARAVVLAAGTMGSARIVLRSLAKYGVRIPILTNMYTVIPSINLNMLGKVPRDRRSSHAQLTLLYFADPSGRWPVLSNFFSYRSLLTFKLLREAPLPLRECLTIMRSLLGLLAVISVFHRDCPSPSKYCVLHRSSDGGPDRLEINYRSSDEERRGFETSEKAVKAVYRQLGCWPIKAVRLPPGSSIHYAGTLPMSKERKELTCDSDCRLFGTRSVYVVDGSVISPLPSTVPTFTVMAIADRAGWLLAQRLKG
jgi:choline dehydrogenase-like flavoprotein